MHTCVPVPCAEFTHFSTAHESNRFLTLIAHTFAVPVAVQSVCAPSQCCSKNDTLPIFISVVSVDPALQNWRFSQRYPTCFESFMTQSLNVTCSQKIGWRHSTNRLVKKGSCCTYIWCCTHLFQILKVAVYQQTNSRLQSQQHRKNYCCGGWCVAASAVAGTYCASVLRCCCC